MCVDYTRRGPAAHPGAPADRGGIRRSSLIAKRFGHPRLRRAAGSGILGGPESRDRPAPSREGAVSLARTRSPPMKPAFVALCLSLPLLAAPPPATATGGTHVVVLGSSTAFGMGPSHPDSAWVNRFRAAAQLVDPVRTVTNLAMPGYTTYHLMPDGFVPPAGRPTPDTARNITEAVDLGADAVLINLPSNDAMNGWSVGTQLANYDLMLAEAAGIPVWISTTQPRNTTPATRANLAEMKDSTLARWGDQAVDFWTTIANPDGTINGAWDSGDGVHLNNAAHGILFARVDAKDVWGGIAPTGARAVPGPDATLRAFASPNPFADGTAIRYVLPQAGRAVLDLYDLSGRHLRTLADTDASAGAHELFIPGADFGAATGVYFFRLSTARAERTGKLVRVR